MQQSETKEEKKENYIDVILLVRCLSTGEMSFYWWR